MPPVPALPRIKADFAKPLHCLFQPKRYKVLYGGRGAGRSWGIARALLLIGLQRPIRVLCARELQISIMQSVHQVLSDQVRLLGLTDHYKIEVGVIKGVNGTQFFFEGIHNNATKIKSYEGVDYCWVEEAAQVTKESWQILIPTIRKETCPHGHRLQSSLREKSEIGGMKCPTCLAPVQQSEIWISFNPDLEEDYTYQRFVKDADTERSFIVRMTYADNPWFPDVLRQEMESAKSRGLRIGGEQDYADYLNVWEGHCRQTLQGAVYARELLKALEEQRLCTVPYERSFPVDLFFDLGRADNTAIWAAQVVAMQYRVLRYYEASGQHISHFLQEIQSWGMTIGTIWLPHDAKAKRLGSRRTIEEQVRQARFQVQIVQQHRIIDGINAARTILPNCWFDEEFCRDGILALKNYSYRVVNGRLSNEPLHNWASDGADAFRYMGVALKSPRSSGRQSVLDRLKAAVTIGGGVAASVVDGASSGRPDRGSSNGWLGR